MSQLYARVFVQILDSSIAEDFETRHVFEDFLKVCTVGENGGIVDMTRQALARKFNVPIEKLNRAIERLEAPDPNSRNQEHEGRRLERLDDRRDWGWQILNWKDYDTLRTRAEVAARVARHRASKNGTPPEKTEPEAPDQAREDAITLLELMNELSGAKLRPVESNINPIVGRLKEDGVDLDGCAKMLRRQWELWKYQTSTTGTAMREYFRPSTIFKTSKFDGYYSARDLPITKQESPQKFTPPNPHNEQINVPRL
jgi:uncharacterized phage protein (TIGR02220 family)